MEGVPIKILGQATLKLFGSVKPRANGRNIVGQQLDPNFVRCYMLRPFVHPVACWWMPKV